MGKRYSRYTKRKGFSQPATINTSMQKTFAALYNINQTLDTSNMLTVLSNKYGEKQKRYDEIDKHREPIYQSIHHDLITIMDTFQAKKSTKTEFIDKILAVNKVFDYQFMNGVNSNYNQNQLKESYQRFKKANNVLFFDLETLSGVGTKGVQELDHIYGYSYSIFNKNSNKTETITGLNGLTPEEAKRYQNMFSGFSSVTRPTSGKYAVMAEYLAKVGASSESLEFDESTGRAILKGNINAVGITTKENILKGIDVLETVNKKQIALSTDGKTVAQKDLEKLYGFIKKSETDQNYSVAGHNILGFDIPVLNQWMVRQNSQMKSLHTSNPALFDSLAMMRLAQAHPKFYDSIYPNGYEGKNPLALETLARTHIPSIYGMNAAHDAGIDVRANIALLNATIQHNGKEHNFGDLVFDLAEESNKKNLSGKVQNNAILIANKGFTDYSRSSKNVFGFTVDHKTGTIKTADGFTIHKDKITYDEKYKSGSIKKNVAYQLNNVAKLQSNAKLRDTIGQIYPNMNADELFVLEMNPISNSDVANKNTISSYFMGTQKDIEVFLSDTFIHYGQYDKYGNVIKNAGAVDLLEESGYPVSPDRKHKGKYPFSLQDIKRRSTYTLNNDSADRSLRTSTAYKATKQLQFSTDVQSIQKELSQVSGKPISKKEATRELLKRINAVSELVASGKGLTLSMQSDLVDKYFIKGSVNTGMLDNFANSLEYIDSIKDHIGIMLDASRNIGDHDLRNTAINMMFNQAKKEAIELHKENPDWKKRQRSNQDHLYQIDMLALDFKTNHRIPLEKDIEDLSDRFIANIDLSSRHADMNLVKELKRVAKLTGNDLSEKQVNKYLVKLAQKEKISVESNQDNHTLSRNIINSLKEKKQKNNQAGIFPDHQYYYESDVSEASALLKDFPRDRMAQISSEIVDRVSNFKKLTYQDVKNNKHLSFIKGFIDEFKPEMYQELGFSSSEIKKLKTAYDLAKGDMQTLYDHLFKGVANSGASLYIDNDHMYIGDEFGHYSKNLTESLPKLRVQSGHIFFDINGVKYGATTHILPENDSHNFVTRSLVGKSIEENVPWYLPSAVKRANEAGKDPILTIESYTKKVAEGIRKSPVISELTPQQAKVQSLINTSKIAEQLPDLIDSGKLNDLDLSEAELSELKKIRKADGTIKSFEQFNDYQHQLWNKIQTKVFERINSNLDSAGKELLEKTSGIIKPTKVEEGYSSFIDFNFGTESYASPNRGHEDTVSNVHAYSREEFARRKEIYNNTAADIYDDIYTGSLMRTEKGYGYFEKKVAYKGMIARDITVRSKFLTSDALKKEINQYLSKNTLSAKEQKATELLQSFNQLTEASALLDARINDAVYQDLGMQVMSRRIKLLEDHAKEIRTIKEISILPNISVKDNRLMSFQYASGTFVRQGQAALKHFNDYSHAYQNEYAKFDGFLRFGYFTKEEKMLVSEQEINKFLKSHDENLTSSEDVHKILSKEFEGRYYLKNLDSFNTVKIAEDGVEKHMALAATAPIGSIDKNIEKAFQKMGLGKLVGRTIDNDFIDTLIDFGSSETTNAKRQELVRLSGKKLKTKVGETYGDAWERITKSVGYTPESFKEALLQERYAPSLMMQRITGANYLSNNQDMKHGNIPVNKMINKLVDHFSDGHLDEKSIREAQEKVYHVAQENNWFQKKSGENGLSFDKEKGLVFDANTYGDVVNTKSILHYMKENKISFGMERVGDKTLTNIGRINDYVGRGTSGDLGEEAYSDDVLRFSKVTDQEMNIMNMVKYDQETLFRMKKELGDSDFEKYFGHVLDQNGIKKEYNHRSVLGSYTDQLLKNQFYEPTDHVLKEDADQFYFNKGKEKVFLSDPLNDVAKHLKKSGYDKLGYETVEQFHSLQQNLHALEFNAGRKDLAFMQDKGFDIINIADYDSETMAQNNVIIDLNNDFFHDSIANKKMSRYLAIGSLPTKKFGEEETFLEPHRILHNIKSQYEILDENWHNPIISGDNRTNVQAQVRAEESVSAFHTALDKSIMGKKGLFSSLASIKMDSTAWGKARIYDPTLGPEDEFLKGLHFDNKSIYDLHKSGRMVDFTVVSRDYIEDLGLFKKDYMQSIGAKTEQDVMNMINKDGLAAISRRNPMIYIGSARSTMLYVNPYLSGNAIIEYAGGSRSGKFDADGDYTNFSVMKSGSHDSIQSRVKGIHDKMFKDHKASMMINAYTRNRYFDQEFKEEAEKLTSSTRKRVQEYFEGSALDEFLFGKSILDDGLSRARMTYSPTEKERLTNKKAYDYAHNAVLSMIEKDKIINRDSAISYLRQNQDEEIETIKRLHLDEDTLNKIQTHFDTINYDAAVASRYKRAHAGEINLALDRTQSLSFMNDHLSNAERTIFQTVRTAAEEGFLSPKHSSSEIVENLNVAGEFNRALTKVTKNRADYTEWLSKHAKGKIEEGFLRDSAVIDTLENKYHFHIRDSAGKIDSDQLRSAAIDAHSIMTQKTLSNVHELERFDFLVKKAGRYKEGVGFENLEKGFVIGADDQSLRANLVRTLSATDADLNITEIDKTVDDFANARRISFAGAEELNIRFANPSGRSGMGSLLSKAVHSLPRGSMGKITAAAAIGLGGIAMLSGFVGGNPITPPSNQAEQQEEDLYSIPDLRQQIEQQTQGSTGGHIINIRARTSKNNAKKISSMVKESLSRAYDSTNLNVSMNINDSSSNINSRGIEDLLLSSI